MDVELVRIDAALDDVLAEAVGAGDEHDVAEAGFGVEGEDRRRSRRRSERTIFMTPTDSADLEVIEAVVDAIDDRAVGEDRGEAVAAGLESLLGTADVQEALVLTGEARGRQILGGRRAAHRDGDPRRIPPRAALVLRHAARTAAVPVAA